MIAQDRQASSDGTAEESALDRRANLLEIGVFHEGANRELFKDFKITFTQQTMAAQRLHPQARRGWIQQDQIDVKTGPVFEFGLQGGDVQCRAALSPLQHNAKTEIAVGSGVARRPRTEEEHCRWLKPDFDQRDSRLKGPIPLSLFRTPPRRRQHEACLSPERSRQGEWPPASSWSQQGEREFGAALRRAGKAEFLAHLPQRRPHSPFAFGIGEDGP